MDYECKWMESPAYAAHPSDHTRLVGRRMDFLELLAETDDEAKERYTRAVEIHEGRASAADLAYYDARYGLNRDAIVQVFTVVPPGSGTVTLL